jgi:hypothetical protein
MARLRRVKSALHRSKSKAADKSVRAPQKLNATLEAEFVGDGFHGFDAEGYVFVEIDA